MTNSKQPKRPKKPARLDMNQIAQRVVREATEGDAKPPKDAPKKPD